LQSQSGDSYRWRTYQALALMLPYYTLGLVQLGAWGLICSLRARRSSLALVAAFAGGLIFLVGIPSSSS
jgi:ABC-type transport system involved in multi-copper enzyme maturation permease subunit